MSVRLGTKDGDYPGLNCHQHPPEKFDSSGEILEYLLLLVIAVEVTHW